MYLELFGTKSAMPNNRFLVKEVLTCVLTDEASQIDCCYFEAWKTEIQGILYFIATVIAATTFRYIGRLHKNCGPANNNCCERCPDQSGQLILHPTGPTEKAALVAMAPPFYRF